MRTLLREVYAAWMRTFCSGCFGTGHVGCERCAPYYPRPKEIGK